MLTIESTNYTANDTAKFKAIERSIMPAKCAAISLSKWSSNNSAYGTAIFSSHSESQFATHVATLNGAHSTTQRTTYCAAISYSYGTTN